jgi:hypothetical protein
MAVAYRNRGVPLIMAEKKIQVALAIGIGAGILIVVAIFSMLGLTFNPTFLLLLFLTPFVIFSLFSLAEFYKNYQKSRAATEKKIELIEVRAAQEPDKTKFAWDLARAKLEAYFDRNLSQVRMIFLVAVAVMAVGFGFVLWGVLLAISKPESIRTSYIAAISGIISQFIGVTFMVIYRSTMTQANQFMEVLERINTVGMAVQILDAIPEGEAELKNSTRAEIVALLLSAKVKSRNGRRSAESVGVKLG